MDKNIDWNLEPVNTLGRVFFLCRICGIPLEKRKKIAVRVKILLFKQFDRKI
jgi:hypothetical protein